MDTGLYDRPRHRWALSFTCPHCTHVTSTPITVHKGLDVIVYCDKCHLRIRKATRTEKRFM